MNNVGTWTWNKATGSFFWSPTMCAIFGRDVAKQELSRDEVKSYYAHFAWTRLLSALETTSNTGGGFDLECEVQLPDGSLKWLRQQSAAHQAKGLNEINGTAQDISNTRQVNRPFQENDKDLLRLLDSLPVCIAYTDINFRYQFINQTYTDWFGLEKTEVIGKHIVEVIGRNAYARVRHHVEQAMLGIPVSYEAHLPYQYGGDRDVAVELMPVCSATGSVQGCYAMIHDISHHKKNEEQLRLSEERWQLALESSGDGVWDWYPQSGVEILSKRLKEIYGYGDDEIPDLSDELDKRTHPDDLTQMRLARQAHFDGLTPIYINEHRVQCKNGSWKWILTRGTVIERDEDGKPLRMVGTHTDISERKQAEVALRESEERLRMALSATHQGLYDLNVQTGMAIVNAEYAHMLGYTHAEFQESHDAWLDRLHPDDKQAADQSYQDYIQGMSPEYRLESRQRKKNGEWVWILSVGAVVEWDKQGKPLRMLGTYLDITARKAAEEMIWQQANIDSLTDLPNRRMFYDRLEHDMSKSRRNNLPLAVLFIDLDHFKEVNDTLGHPTGDALLIEAAHRLRTCVRESDTVARLGGDEFTVSLPDQHDMKNVDIIAQHIIEKMSSPFLLGNEEVFLSASIGITVYPDDAENLEDLLKHADQAMYAAKDSGRNRFNYFTPDLQVAAIARMRLTSDLRVAIAEKQLQVYFQPIVDMESGRIHKAEALIRWPHHQMGFVSPAEFIPIAEASGLILPIGQWVFQEAVHWVRRWRELHDDEFQISINQSPLEFQGDAVRYTDWIKYMQQIGLPGQAISVEITEGLLLDASGTIIEKLLQFRDAGIQVALDDFGTGYSSLSYLKKFDIDYLKIDQSFVRNLRSGSNDIALTEAIIMMAHKLGLKVIAEGVETEEQRALLKRAQCDYAQGYLFARPLPPAEFEAMVLGQK